MWPLITFFTYYDWKFLTPKNSKLLTNLQNEQKKPSDFSTCIYLSLSNKQSSLIRNGAGSGRSMRWYWGSSTHDVVTAPICNKKRTWTPLRTLHRYSTRTALCYLSLTHYPSIASTSLQLLVVWILWLDKILQAAHFC